jgi:hypothetical protein
MNVELLREVREAILGEARKLELKMPDWTGVDSVVDVCGFDMSDFLYSRVAQEAIRTEYFNPKTSCKSALCIGGWAAALWSVKKGIPLVYGVAYHSRARDALDLTELQASALFYPDVENEIGELSKVTAAHAAAVIDHLIETGEVDWFLPGWEAHY